MTKRPIALVLAGTIPHIDLIEKLKRRGYETTLVDYAEYPPAKSYADSHVLESALDSRKVREIAIRTNASLVISTAGEGYVVACQVAEELQLPAPFSFDTALTFSNKISTKERMIDKGIPTARYAVIDSTRDLESVDLRFPVVVKPADSYGSKGVRAAHDKQTASAYVDKAIELSKSRRAMVEEFKAGTEVSVYGFVDEGATHILQVSEKLIIDSTEPSVIQNVGTLTPPGLSADAQNSLKSVTSAIASAFGINNTPLLVQAIVDENDAVSVIEVEPRLGGGLSYKVVHERTGFDLMEAAIDSYLGIPVRVSTRDGHGYHLIINIYARPCVFGRLVGYDELIGQGIIDSVYVNKSSGTRLGKDLSSSDRVGKIVICAEDRESLLTKLNSAIKALDVLDIDKRSVMRKDIYRNMIMSISKASG